MCWGAVDYMCWGAVDYMCWGAVDYMLVQVGSNWLCLSKCCPHSLRALKTKLAKEYPKVVAGETCMYIHTIDSGALAQEMFKSYSFPNIGLMWQQRAHLTLSNYNDPMFHWCHVQGMT